MRSYTLRLSKTGVVGLRDSPCSRTVCTLRGAHRSSAYPVFEILRVYILLCLFFLSGCISFLPSAPPPAERVVLAPVFEFPSHLKTVRWTLAVEQPLAATPFDSKRMMINIENDKGFRTFEPLTGLEWNDYFPLLLQQQIISAFEKSGKIIGIGRSDEDFNADLLLQVTIKDAEIILRGPEQQAAQLELSVKLISKKDRKIVAQHTFKGFSDIKKRTQASFIRAYERVLGQTISNIVVWTLRENSH